MIDWNAVTKEDSVKIRAITQRVISLCETKNFEHVSMDLTACHVSGNPLDLDKLAKFDAFDFIHDIAGIDRHLDRETGELRNCFLPRCSA